MLVEHSSELALIPSMRRLGLIEILTGVRVCSKALGAERSLGCNQHSIHATLAIATLTCGSDGSWDTIQLSR